MDPSLGGIRVELRVAWAGCVRVGTDLDRGPKRSRIRHRRFSMLAIAFPVPWHCLQVLISNLKARSRRRDQVMVPPHVGF